MASTSLQYFPSSIKQAQTQPALKGFVSKTKYHPVSNAGRET